MKVKINMAQKIVYECVLNYTRDHGYPPTHKELCELTGLSSPSTVHTHLQSLEELGLIRRTPRKSRGIEVIEIEDERDQNKPL